MRRNYLWGPGGNVSPPRACSSLSPGAHGSPAPSTGGPWPRDALPSGRAERAAADSSVTAAMSGMRTPPSKWRPAARAGSITGSVASALAHDRRKRHPGLGREGRGCAGRAWKPQMPSLPQPGPSCAQPAPGDGCKAATDLSSIPSPPGPSTHRGHETPGIPDMEGPQDGHGLALLCGGGRQPCL